MKFLPSKERAALILFLLYVADLIWKLVHWREFTAGLSRAELVLPLSIRFLLMGGFLFMYFKFRKDQSKGNDGTK
jgi:hypothetical protein